MNRGLYSRYILPKLVHCACASRPATRQRRKVVPRAQGRVLEIGIGSGLNLPHYDPAGVELLFALDPSKELWAMAGERLDRVKFPVEYVEAFAGEIPLETGSVDSVVVTYTLCSIPDRNQALAEMRRVLRPGGELLFCEHGLAPDEKVRKWQHRLNPVWRRLAGGCNLNIDMPAVIRAAGFTIRELETVYLSGLKPASCNYRGVAHIDRI